MSILQENIFEKNWEIYQKIIANNYMLHQELALESSAVMSTIAEDNAVDILDLGCGDANQISKQISAISVNSYTGIDLSIPALTLAKENLNAIHVECDFQVGPMESLIKNKNKNYNIIYSSYALHHLKDEDKKIFLIECYNKLSFNGAFILIDLFRDDNQSLEDFKENYTKMLNADWHMLKPEEKEMVIDHIQQYDFPTHQSTIIDWSKEIGYVVDKSVNLDNKHGAVILKKTNE
jgi:2-polyprenyl-3-methyl-5-hydroxy-6-metoxy-1,4-benzoquinol methylase